ncbi:Zn(II)2Cys6 transcription factor [Aspergillus clavatus NRRL 1]|uniref:Fungal specific transcription factor domain protein n=1 Tax=Aspergillus clavatus (strain ATCC 1007 / CBS 513.65 / DSM 816 / NCTC 3887 / NRRL 1 / QM 1276 / 107) TaxID=344612 RepID=A1C5T2_ASPCL|nr:fungal specific transcription factor domain protein [Aspergillus clavatus NRRL 1]EAW15050.1 fungal specific transcription factor domain protein [Aspergillus clavatus NRRL 1]
MEKSNQLAVDNPRRRNRRINSCLACRQRKLKCNRQQPCSNCARAGRECAFLRLDSQHSVHKKLAIFKEQTALLEKCLERDTEIAKSTKLGPASPEEDEDDLLITSLELALLGIQDAAYDHEDDDDSDDDLYDLGFRFGKMRVNERVGGFFHPQMADELSTFLDEMGNPTALRTPNRHNLSAAEKDLYFGPGPYFIPPQSGLFFSQSCSASSMTDWASQRPMADALLKQYWEAVHPIVRIAHRPSLERRYRTFWEAIDTGGRPPASLRALICSMLFIAVVSMSTSTVLHQFGIAQQILQNHLQFKTEKALKDARLLSTTRLETLQAFVLYLIPMCRSEISRAHSALVGMAVRLAESLGLHRDPKESQYSVVESHVRRLAWYQVCFLDLRTAEVQGPRVAIQPEDFSVELPVNLDDEQIAAGVESDPLVWTDMTYTRIRFECQEMQRKCLLARLQLEQKKLPLSQALRQIDTFRQHMEFQYGPIFSQTELTPLQIAAKHLMTLLINRLYTAVLHQFYRAVIVQPPLRLRQLVVSTGIQQLESSIALETMPQLQLWAWYSQAYHQYHVSMLLLLEVYLRPTSPGADRIWPCLDYVYETTTVADLEENRNLTSQNRKAWVILTALRDRIDVYRRMRRARVPVPSTRVIRQPVSSFEFKQPESTSLENNLPECGPRTGIVGHSLFHGGMEQTDLTEEDGVSLINIDLPENNILSSFVDFDWSEWDTLHHNAMDGTF